MGCVDSKSGIETEEHKCNILTKMDTIRPCNTQQCATWQTSMWSQVSCIYLHLFFKGLFSNSQWVLHLTNCSNLINIFKCVWFKLSSVPLPVGKPSRFVRWSVPRTRTVTRTRNPPPYSLASSRNVWRGNTAHGIRYRFYPPLSERYTSTCTI